jgi:hypothetical protein
MKRNLRSEDSSKIIFRVCTISPPTKACCSLKAASNHLVTLEQFVRNAKKYYFKKIQKTPKIQLPLIKGAKLGVRHH